MVPPFCFRTRGCNYYSREDISEDVAVEVEADSD